jgi:hypothetical protein
MSRLADRPGGSAPLRRPPFPESIPPGLNHLVVTGTLSGEPRQAKGPQGDVVVLFPMAFPVRDPERPQQLWTWASCEVEAPGLVAEQSLSDLRVGAPVLAGGQLGERDGGDGGRRGVIVASNVHPGDLPGDHRTQLFLPGDAEGWHGPD